MSTSKGYYSLIQFCPDPSRAETVNIGVLLFCPEKDFIRAQTSLGNRRIERFFKRGSFNPDQVNAAKKAIEARLELEPEQFKTLDDLQRFIDTRANQIVITQPRSMRVEDPEQDLQDLHEELVGDGPQLAMEPAALPELPILDQTFKQLAPTSSRVQLNVTFVVPVIKREIRAKYAYQNHFFNLVRPASFSGDENRATNAAMLLAIEGDLIKRHSGESGQEARLIVVSASADEKAADRIEARVAPLFQDYEVRFVRRGQIDEFAREVEHDVTAH